MRGLVGAALLTVVGGFGLPPAVTALPAIYDGLLTTRPITTRIWTAVTLAHIGDAISQHREREQKPEKARLEWKYNVRRTASFAVVEATYRGLLQQPIFLWIIANFHGNLLSRLPGVSTPLAAAMERVAFNQFVVSPCVYYPLYFAITGPGQGLTLRQTLHRAKSQFACVFGCNTFFWLPVQLIQFALVPAKYKVPFICLAALTWNMIISRIAGCVREFRRHGLQAPQQHIHDPAKHDHAHEFDAELTKGVVSPSGLGAQQAAASP